MAPLSDSQQMALRVAERYSKYADEDYAAGVNSESLGDADAMAYNQRAAIICLLTVLVESSVSK